MFEMRSFHCVFYCLWRASWDVRDSDALAGGLVFLTASSHIKSTALGSVCSQMKHLTRKTISLWAQVTHTTWFPIMVFISSLPSIPGLPQTGQRIPPRQEPWRWRQGMRPLLDGSFRARWDLKCSNLQSSWKAELLVAAFVNGLRWVFLVSSASASPPAVQRDKFRLRGADKPREEGAVWSIWRTGAAGGRRRRSRHGWHLLPHLWRRAVRVHGWPGQRAQRGQEERRGYGSSSQVSSKMNNDYYDYIYYFLSIHTSWCVFELIP